MIAAGEAGGILDTILKRLAIYIEKAVKLKSQVKSAMIYPIAVIVIAAVVVGVILWKVIPTFASCSRAWAPSCRCRRASSSRSATTSWRSCRSSSSASCVFAFAFKRYYATERGRRVVDGIDAEAADPRHDPAQDRGGALLPHAVDADGSGVPILDGLDITARTSGNAIIEDAIQ